MKKLLRVPKTLWRHAQIAQLITNLLLAALFASTAEIALSDGALQLALFEAAAAGLFVGYATFQAVHMYYDQRKHEQFEEWAANHVRDMIGKHMKSTFESMGFKEMEGADVEEPRHKPH